MTYDQYMTGRFKGVPTLLSVQINSGKEKNYGNAQGLYMEDWLWEASANRHDLVCEMLRELVKAEHERPNSERIVKQQRL